MKGMENLTNDRLHTDGTKALYPTFVNVRQQRPPSRGDAELFVIRLKAKKASGAVRPEGQGRRDG